MNKSEARRILQWFSDCGISDISVSAEETKRNISKRIESLADLKDTISKINISIKECALNMVFGSGNKNADILLLGEAPGAEEDKQGLPFVGQSGHLLDKILESVGLSRSNVYITNILPWRPPGNRTPTNQEIDMFRPYVIKHISLVNPKIVVCLGGTATKALLQTSQGIMQLRGKWTKISELSAKILPTFHPAYLLRSPSQKREAWLDFLRVKNCL